MRRLKIIRVALIAATLAIASISHSQVTKVDDLLIRNPAEDKSDGEAKKLMWNPITKKVVWADDGGGGGSQTLDQTLINGNTSARDIILQGVGPADAYSVKLNPLSITSSFDTGAYDHKVSITPNLISVVSGNDPDEETYTAGTEVYFGDRSSSEQGIITEGLIQFRTSNQAGDTQLSKGLIRQDENSTGEAEFVFKRYNNTFPQVFHLATTEDFKTINGQSIIGTGDITIGGGSTPTLDQVLLQGNTTNKIANFQTSGGNTYTVVDYNGIGLENLSEQTRISLDPTESKIRVSDLVTNSSVTTYKDRITFTKMPYNTHLTVDTPIGNTFINMPMKPSGTYTLATLSDIPSGGGSQDLDQTLTNGNTSNKSINLIGSNTNINIAQGPRVMKLSDIGLSFSDSNEAFSTRFATAFTQISNTTGPGSFAFKYPMPVDFTINRSEFLPISVNGNYADANGNITISGSGSQNLQQTLDNGRTWSDPGGLGLVTFGDLIPGTIAISTNTVDGKNTSLQMSPTAGIGLIAGSSGVEQVQLQLPMITGATVDFKTPADKVTGTYTLATTEDVNLHNVVAASGVFVSDDSNQYIKIFNNEVGIDEEKMFKVYSANTDGSSTYLNLDTGEFSVTISDPTALSGSSLWMDKGDFYFTKKRANLQTTVGFLNPTSNSTINFPAKPLDGTYTLATTSDFKTINGQSIIGTGDMILATKANLRDWVNQAGQIKVNYTGLSTADFTANVTKTLDINAATPTIVPSPTTKLPIDTPEGYVGIFDAARGTSPTGRLIENPIGGQTHLWRFQVSYSNKASGNNGSLDLILTNPVSGFQYVMPFTLPSGRTSGTLNNIAITIADDASIPAPNGYILQAQSSFTDTNLTLEVVSITRISNAVENYDIGAE